MPLNTLKNLKNVADYWDDNLTDDIGLFYGEEVFFQSFTMPHVIAIAFSRWASGEEG